MLEEQFEIVDTVQDGLALVDAVQRLKPDLAVVDISMPGLSGLEATRELRTRGEPVEVLVLTVTEDRDVIEEAFRSGARGYVSKACMGIELVTAVESVLSGHTYLSERMAE